MTASLLRRLYQFQVYVPSVTLCRSALTRCASTVSSYRVSVAPKPLHLRPRSLQVSVLLWPLRLLPAAHPGKFIEVETEQRSSQWLSLTTMNAIYPVVPHLPCRVALLGVPQGKFKGINATTGNPYSESPLTKLNANLVRRLRLAVSALPARKVLTFAPRTNLAATMDPTTLTFAIILRVLVTARTVSR